MRRAIQASERWLSAVLVSYPAVLWPLVVA